MSFKFKIGDRVKLVRMEDENTNLYKKYLGQEFEIEIIYNYTEPHCTLKGNNEIAPYIKNLELVKKYTYKDLKKSPIGTKITFENGVFLIKNRANRYENSSYWREDKDFKEMEDVIGTLGKIIKIEEPEYKKVYEYKPEILDETEKRYLRGVIRPFREKVRDIEIIQDKSMSREFITIRFKDDGDLDFPYFQINTMYKGMEKDKKYTLEELGL